MRVLPLVALFFSSCSWPDEVSISPRYDRREFLGGHGSAPYFSNDISDDMGLELSVTWYLKPREFTLIQAAVPWQPPIAQPSTTTKVDVHVPESKPKPSVLDQSLGAGAEIDSWSAGTKVLIAFILVVVLIATYIFRRYVPILCKLIPTKRTSNDLQDPKAPASSSD